MKSSNIIVNSFGQVTLVDLGEAKQISVDSVITPQKTFCGTPHMMAPEFHNGDYLNGYAFEVDYYSFGMLLFELALGKAPFGYAKQNESLEEDIKAGISQETLDQLEDSKLRALCATLLQKEPKERLSEMKTLKEHEFFRDQVDWQDVADFA